MTPPDRITSIVELTATIDALMAASRRTVIGLAGPPGAGKSHLARFIEGYVATTRGGRLACVVPMDGFHLSDEILRDLGRRERKGASDTFDVDGFVHLLDRLRARSSEVVYAPRFVRQIEAAVAGSIAVGPDVELIIVEGNYLLLDAGPWRHVAPRLDVTFYVDAPADVRRERLIARHRRTYGTIAAAVNWVDTVDQPNAEVVESSRSLADHLVVGLALPDDGAV